ncbi:MAG: adenylate/guanylate cyclase domain-containing protein, partial [Actinobacteria bacterium]|nr:adenylate/guanylate cyclase domain-containing protein [Actinomycetota bacterium]
MDEAGVWQGLGLYDPGAPDAEERLALLRFLCDLGATDTELVEAQRLGRLAALGGALVRRGSGPWFTPEELAERGVADVDTVRRIWQAAGLPPVPAESRELSSRDVGALEAFVAASTVFGEDEVLQFTRAVGAALAAVADASQALFGLTVAGDLSAAGASDLEYAQAFAEGSQMLVDVVPDVMSTLFLHHVDHAVDRYLAGGGDEVGARVTYLAIGFVDLVESTAMVHDLPADDIADALTAFEHRATEVVAAHHGRVVKTIGDEVMFVATTAADAVEIAVALVTFAEEHPALRGLRGGLAWGPLVRGYGDYYGPVVNLAARAVKEARPGEVLADLELVGQVQAATGLRVGSPREHELRGFVEPVVLWPVERRAPGP